jgi:Tol biopolymer transport system component
MRPAVRALTLTLAAACALALPAASRADVFEPISLASVGLLEGGSIIEQADVAEHPAVSGDSRYVAFDGSFGGVSGVWRAELLNGGAGQLRAGRIEQVAGGDAQLPSISDDGRFVSFTTNEGKGLPAITNGAPDLQPQREAVNVYVRDMSKPAGEATAFTVASAPSGSSEPLTYTTSGFVPEFGSVAAGRSALSADGRYVAFVTSAESNLAGPNTPARQVAVRDTLTRETKLVTTEYEGAPTNRPVATTTEGSNTYGAVYGFEEFPTHGGAALSLGASLSADGSTVAWMGQQIGRQAPIFSGRENRPEYIEPLWRKIQPPGPTRRITGGANPSEPGPFEPNLRGGGIEGIYAAVSRADVLPRLSGDGQLVAFLASQRLISAGEEFRGAENSDDLYLVDMAPGLTRTQALRRLTELASGNVNIGGGADALTDLSVSADGTQIGFTTRRTAFPLGSPSYVSVPQATAGMEEVYDVDLANDTLTRVTHGYESEAQQSLPAGQLVEQMEAASPSFSQDGNELAFSSAATNLVYGETNGADSAFVVSRKRFAAEVASQEVSPAPPNPTPQPDWRLNAFARSRRDGSVVLEVEVPGAGRLSASAAGPVPVRATSANRRRRGSRGARRRRGGRTTRVATRRLAAGAKDAAQEGAVTLTLALTPAYRALALQPGGLSALAGLQFTAPGHATLRQNIPVTFVDRVHRARHGGHSRGKHRR